MVFSTPKGYLVLDLLPQNYTILGLQVHRRPTSLQFSVRHNRNSIAKKIGLFHEVGSQKHGSSDFLGLE